MRDEQTEKFPIDYLIINHLHKDNLSTIDHFTSHFHANVLVAPNNYPNTFDNYEHRVDWEQPVIKWEQISGNEDKAFKTLKEMVRSADNPTPLPENPKFFRLSPEVVENGDEFEKDDKFLYKDYQSNISIVTMFDVNGDSDKPKLLILGDLKPMGMKKLLFDTIGFKDRHIFRACLCRNGVDVLVAPPHCLLSDFSDKLFEAMKDEKTRCINVVSETLNTNEVCNGDEQYNNPKCCQGENFFNGHEDLRYGVGTSRGHILIDYSSSSRAMVDVVYDSKDLVKAFRNSVGH